MQKAIPESDTTAGVNAWMLWKNLQRNVPVSCLDVNMPMYSRIPGAQANMAVEFAILKHGDTLMGMNLAHGGHLTHGSPANFSGSYFNVVSYGVNDDGFIDYEQVRQIALENKTKADHCRCQCLCTYYRFQKIP